MPTPAYLEAFREHARGSLDAQVVDHLHKRARGTAGGKALRQPTVRLIRFQGGKWSERPQVVEWLRQNNYNEAGLMPDGEGWLFHAHGGLPMTDEQTRSLGPGITATVGKYAPEGEGEKKGGMLDAVAKIWTAVIRAAGHDDAPPGSEPAEGAVEPGPAERYVAKAGVPDEYFDAASLLAGQDSYLARGHVGSHARSLALAMIEKDADAFRDERDAWTWGPPDLQGLDVQLGGGAERLKGYFGIDVYKHDHGTVVHDLNLGIPLPTASVRSLVVTKAMGCLVEDPAGLMWEARRVLMPGGRLLTREKEPVLKGSQGGLVPLGGRPTPLGPMFDALRVTDADEEAGDIRKLLEHSPGFEVHQAGVSDNGPEVLAGLPEGKREMVRKALSPNRVAPMVTASQHRQIVYCTVLEPHSFDAHGDTMTPEDIEYTAHRYLTKSRVIGSGHAKAIQARPVESFIAPMDLFYENGPFGAQKVTKGSWVIGIHVEDPKEWDKVVSGEYTGVSIGGFGMREAI